MKGFGRHRDNALLRTVVNQNLQTFSHKRLLKDLEEIEKEKIPTCGVTARPLENDVFTWHANIRGPAKTPYEGGVFHLQLKFPKSYPNHPPTIRFFNNLPHPNVFENRVCLNILQQNDVSK